MITKQIIHKNTTLSFKESGKGNALVFLHGFLENSSMWDACMNYFESKYRVIAIDLLGHGETGCTGYVHNMEDMADAVYAIISELKLRKVTLIGHSMGGYVALAFAELYPDSVRSLALVASTSRADSEERQINRDRAMELVKKNSSIFVTMSISNLFGEAAQKQFPKAIELAKSEALKTSKQGMIAALEGMKIRPDREVIFHFAPYPILLILGKNDTVIPYEEALDQIEGSPVQLVSTSGGHMVHIENETELLDVLGKFFKLK
ncbi:alpha/beta fold hydrolase [Flavobacterium sp. HSC-61S13]|uniref:alpha/beta fold hydrolase n=1 Tax=Flavobacterium sp. HSC-61S13 TaxID=2910963 RepID=UPI00209EE634|nr:alpha/beta hydrolase [Flavobacterium sp. HSC-61S13]MCP1995256.1 pimeloyl-ACP methyl ester carboxylesterase [Flavobacterium sp. HSC-61S13]